MRQNDDLVCVAIDVLSVLVKWVSVAMGVVLMVAFMAGR